MNPQNSFGAQPAAEIAITWAGIEQDFRNRSHDRARSIANTYCLYGAVDAEDVIQEGYLKALTNADQFVPGNIGGWVHTIIRNTARDHVGSAPTRRTVSAATETLNNLMPHDVASSCVLPPHEHVDRVAGGDEIMKVLGEGINPDFIEPFLLHVSGHTNEEIERLTGIPISTVRTRMSRLRIAAKKLAEDGVLEVPEHYRRKYLRDGQ